MPLAAWPQGWTHKIEATHQPGRPWNLVVVDEPARVPGDRTQKFEVRYGDVGDMDRSRNGYAWERCELAQAQPLQSAGQQWWYGWSFLVPPDFPDAMQLPETSGLIHLAQFHQRPAPGQTNWDPAWMFGKRRGGPFVVRSFPNRNREMWWTLVDEASFRGRWHDVLVHARWSGEDDGFMKVWVDGVQVMGFSGATCNAGGGEIYHKYGIYRVSHESNPPAVAWFSQLRRGRAREEVDIGGIPRPAVQFAQPPRILAP